MNRTPLGLLLVALVMQAIGCQSTPSTAPLAFTPTRDAIETEVAAAQTIAARLTGTASAIQPPVTRPPASTETSTATVTPAVPSRIPATAIRIDTPTVPNPTVAPTAVPSDIFYIINYHTQECLTVFNSTDEPWVKQAKCEWTPNQRWKRVPAFNDFFLYVNQYSNTCLDVEGRHLDAPWDIANYPCEGVGSQLWKLKSVGTAYDLAGMSQALGHAAPLMEKGDYYQLFAQHSGKCVDVDGWNHDSPGRVIYHNCADMDNDNQLWAVRSQSVPVPTPTPVPTLPATCPRVCITNVRVDPPDPKQNRPINFVVTFSNATGANQRYRWFVFVYDYAEKGTPIGQTSSAQDYIILPGTSEWRTVGDGWKIGPGKPCYTYTGKVHWLAADGSKPVFPGVNGQELQFPFTVCPQ